MSSSMITHLLITTRYVVKGTVRTGGRRLQAHLGEEGPAQLIVKDATLWELGGGRRIQAQSLFLRRSEVVLSHEYLDLGGDPHRSQLEAEPERSRVSMILSEPSGWLVNGSVRTTEDSAHAADGVVVLLDPEVFSSASQTEGASQARDAVAGLAYLLVNRSYVHCTFRDD